MPVSVILNTLLQDSIHLGRINSLTPLIESIICTKKTRLTVVGRALSGKLGTQERSCIRRVDRCLANTYYQNHSKDIYTSLSHWLLEHYPNPIIIIDWSCAPNSSQRFEQGSFCILRATLASIGRGITLYEELHEKQYENNPKIHHQFLEHLKKVIPSQCKPVIVTDAGFKNPWFKAVASLGWDYVGRIRGLTSLHDGTNYLPVKQWFERIKNKAEYLGELFVAKTNPMKTHCYSYKYPLKGRKKYGRIKHDNVAIKASQGYREPWILVSSLTKQDNPGMIIQIYKHRMTIEENFRDTKSPRFGFGLKENVCLSPERFSVWLMLVALATLIAFYVGQWIERIGLHRQCQANSYKHKRVLSFVFIGCQAIKNNKVPIFDIRAQTIGINL
ncbi:TPA: IS4 family transposase [Legionella bozemanae]|uniref:IS4 family transposase n=1 Tax=Legionella bozemanae TaxID=447 RepID=UPI0010416F98|nr:IS4 family transposase [Legionella bozemanae]